MSSKRFKNLLKENSVKENTLDKDAPIHPYLSTKIKFNPKFKKHAKIKANNI